jgi:hypothetical protein
MRRRILYDANNRVVSLFQLLERIFVPRIVFAFQGKIDKEPVIGVNLGSAERLAIDWDQAFALLAGRLCE